VVVWEGKRFFFCEVVIVEDALGGYRWGLVL
jgi:hypothetical protein